jgi:ribonuclease Z
MPEKLKITFLGTGSSVPTPKKNHVGNLISYGTNNILIDCGEGIQRQFKIAGLNLCKLTHILISHWHGDHTLGIPGLLFTLRMSDYQKTLNIYGPKGTKKNIYLFEKIYGTFKIKHKIHEISTGKILDTKDFFIETLPMKHGIKTNAYTFVIKDKLRLNKTKLKKLNLPNSPLISKLQQGKDITHPKTKKKIKSKSVTYLEKGKKITIIMDTSINSNAIKLAKNSDLIICEASFTEDQKDKAIEYKHLTIKQAATIAKRSNSKKLILTHNSQRYGNDIKPILDEARKVFKNSSLAKDFDEVIL